MKWDEETPPLFRHKHTRETHHASLRAGVDAGTLRAYELIRLAMRDPAELMSHLQALGAFDEREPSTLYPSFEAARDALVREWVARDLGEDLLEQASCGEEIPLLDGLAQWLVTLSREPGQGTWAMVYGDYGSGKTTQGVRVLQTIHEHAAETVIHEPREYMWHPRFLRATAAARVVYANEADMLESMRPEADEPRPLKYWRDAPWLILDECGGGRITEWGEEKIYAVLNHRYQRRKPTLLISNHNPGELVKRWRQPRLGSRLIQRLGGPHMPRAFTMRGNHRW